MVTNVYSNSQVHAGIGSVHEIIDFLGAGSATPVDIVSIKKWYPVGLINNASVVVLYER